MKILVTGSLGNISRPLAQQLVQKGHEVTVVSSRAERKKEIEILGAKAAIGSMYDVAFLSDTFRGQDVVYLMEAVSQNSFFDPEFDIIETYRQIAENYRQAVVNSGIKKLIHLSSIGAHTAEGNGVLRMHYYAEQILRQLPNEVAIKFMRPVSFYTNLYRSMQVIKTKNMIVSNHGGDQKEPWVSPLDIASVIVEEIETSFESRIVRYIASDEISPNEIAQAIGEAIGKPDLQWIKISDEELFENMVHAGMNRQLARGFTEMHAAQCDGSIYEDYNKNKPGLSNVKLQDFAREFAIAFNQNQ